jgi:hypothetical protein
MWTTLVALLLATVGCLVPGSASASTTTSTSHYIWLYADVPGIKPSVSPSTQETVLISAPLSLKAGETRRIMDRLGVTLNSSEGAEVDNHILCSDSSVPPKTIAETSSGTNHRGSGAGEIGLKESLLLTAPADGTYTCELRALTRDGSRTGYRMTAVAGTPSPTAGTWLQISSAGEFGTQIWSNHECNSEGTWESCVYLGGSGAPREAHLFSGPDPQFFTASPDTTQVDVVGTFQITSCYHNTKSCTSNHWGGGGLFDDTGAKFRSFIQLNQLNPDGSVCLVNQSSDDGTPSPADTPSQGAYYIRKSVHHLPVNYHVTANVSPNCNGSRQFVLDLFVGWTNGVPIKLDNGGFNVISNVHTSTVPVPDVVGMSEARAIDLLKSSLNPMTTRRFFNPAPAGTVFAQDPAGGTVAPLGSEVDLSVSAGPAAVPDLLYWPASDAMTQITAHGFVVGQVTSVNNCAWSGWVVQQSPPGGTPAPPGTAVNIGIGTC